MWIHAKRKSDCVVVRAFRIAALDVWPPGVNVRTNDDSVVLELPKGHVSPSVGGWLVADAQEHDAVVCYLAGSDYDLRYDPVVVPAWQVAAWQGAPPVPLGDSALKFI